MLENAVYSVITVEGCAAILWKDGKSPEMQERAAKALRITAPDLLELGVIDEIVPEPVGGAHVDHEARRRSLQEALVRNLEELRRFKPEKLVRRRREKFLRMGEFDGVHRWRRISSRSRSRATARSSSSGTARTVRASSAASSSRPIAARISAASTPSASWRPARCGGCAHGCGTAAARAQGPPRRDARGRAPRARALAPRTRARAARRCERVKAHALVMKVSDAEWQWDRKKLTIYFTAEKRVDFRALVRDLAALFRTRIELKQIGVRDEAKRLDGIGRCGREYCSASWLPELRPVNLQVAKDQQLSLNPSQISRRVRAADVLPALRARVLRAEPQALPQGGQDPRHRRAARRRSSPTTSSATASRCADRKANRASCRSPSSSGSSSSARRSSTAHDADGRRCPRSGERRRRSMPTQRADDRSRPRDVADQRRPTPRRAPATPSPGERAGGRSRATRRAAPAPRRGDAGAGAAPAAASGSAAATTPPRRHGRRDSVARVLPHHRDRLRQRRSAPRPRVREDRRRRHRPLPSPAWATTSTSSSAWTSTGRRWRRPPPTAGVTPQAARRRDRRHASRRCGAA